MKNYIFEVKTPDQEIGWRLHLYFEIAANLSCLHSEECSDLCSACRATNIDVYLTCMDSSTVHSLTPLPPTAPDEEHTTEHTPNHHVPQPPQAVFPACICAAVLPIVHLMEDGEVREDGVAGIDLH